MVHHARGTTTLFPTVAWKRPAISHEPEETDSYSMQHANFEPSLRQHPHMAPHTPPRPASMRRYHHEKAATVPCDCIRLSGKQPAVSASS